MSLELKKGASVDDVRCLREKCSLLFLRKGLILACSFETLSDGLDESFHDANKYEGGHASSRNDGKPLKRHQLSTSSK